MPELKKIRVREAKFRDLGLFKKLWAGLLEQQEKEGSHIVANEQSLCLYEGLFRAYVEQGMEGFVLFVADKGVLMWGETNAPLDYGGKAAMVWGCYVVPGAPVEIANALSLRAMERAKEHEFTVLLAQSYEHSKPVEGFERVASVVRRTINE